MKICTSNCGLLVFICFTAVAYLGLGPEQKNIKKAEIQVEQQGKAEIHECVPDLFKIQFDCHLDILKSD